MPGAIKPPPQSKLAEEQQAFEQRQKQAQRTALVLKQISDPTRLRTLLMLSDGEKHVVALADELGVAQPVVNHHLSLLRHGGLVTPRRHGRSSYYELTEAGERLAKLMKAIMG